MPKINFYETGTSGLQAEYGFIREAYSAELRWPTVQPLYNRMRRSDPEISIIRQVYSALARKVNFTWELPENPSSDDKRAQEFAQQVIDDIADGPSGFMETMISNVPFFGWGWWEAVPGLRDPAWTPPGDDPWRSEYKDGLIGFRRLAFRDTSSFDRWDLDDKTGRLRGMVQQDWPNPAILLPLESSLHLTFGDSQSPEGLTPLEAEARLERMKYGFEIVMGIGFEHSAGYLNVNVNSEITDAIKAQVREAARAVLTAQEGNFATWPSGVEAEIKDVPFQAAGALLETIKYYSILKLTLFNMQWVALSSMTGAGSYSAMQDSSSMFMITFNAMMDGFASQMDAQIGKRLFAMNAGAFPGMTRRPRLAVTPLEKVISLAELGQILTPLKNTIPLGDEDYLAIRRRSGFLPESLPVEDKSTPADNTPAENSIPVGLAVPESMRKWREWCRVNDPATYAKLNARIK